MPAALAPCGWPVWPGEERVDLPHVKMLLAPYPSDCMICRPISARVGSVKSNDLSPIEPIVCK
jgi:putative SOS response-associated peptidase YedK